MATPTDLEMTAACQEAYAYASEVPVFMTLEILHTSFLSSVKVVNSDTSLATPQGTFIPAPFDIQLPEVRASARGELQITVPFLPKDVQVALLAASETRDPITIKYREYLGPNESPCSELPIPLEISALEMTRGGVVARALFPDLVNMPFPRQRYTISTFPGAQVG